MQVTTIGFGLSKNVFQVHGVAESGAVVIGKRLRRAQVLAFFADLPPCLVGMEACASATARGGFEVFSLMRTKRLPLILVGGATNDPVVHAQWDAFNKWLQHKGPRPALGRKRLRFEAMARQLSFLPRSSYRCAARDSD